MQARAFARGAAKVVERGLVGAFLVVLFLPITDSIFGIDRSKMFHENRMMAERPTFAFNLNAIGEYPRQFESYDNDHFGYRNRLLRWHHKLQSFFGRPADSGVMYGKDGWMYLATNNALDAYRVTRPFTAEGLDEWTQELTTMRDWLADRGIKFMFICAPAKATIYPDHLPDYVRPLRKTTRLDQLLDHLRTSTDIEAIDLRPSLRKERKSRPVYFMRDTHWNDLGAYISFQEITKTMVRMLPQLAGPAQEPYSIKATKSYRADLLVYDGITPTSSTIYADDNFLIEPVAGIKSRIIARQDWPENAEAKFGFFGTTAGHPDPQRLRAVIFHDSFGYQLIPFFSELFHYVSFKWQYSLDHDLIEKTKPDIVILQLVERVLMTPAKKVLGPRPDSPDPV